MNATLTVSFWRGGKPMKRTIRCEIADDHVWRDDASGDYHIIVHQQDVVLWRDSADVIEASAEGKP